MEYRTSRIKQLTITAAGCIVATPLFAQDATIPAPETQAEPLPWIMLGVMGVLCFILVGFGLLLRSALVLKHGRKEEEKQKSGSSYAIHAITLLLLMTGSHGAFAQDASPDPVLIGGMHPYLFYGIVVVNAILAVLILLLYRAIMQVLKPAPAVGSIEKERPGILSKLTAAVPVSREQDVMLDHEYDGIRELDNDLPPWWKYGFYVTIVFACIYIWRFHMDGGGKLQLAEYEEQNVTAEKEIAAYKEKTGNLVDENNATALTDASSLTNGKTLFTANCAACHGQLGEGGVGPNLTDAYWLHGGSMSDVFKTIKYGWPQKGMKAWEKDFGAKQIQEISSFILTLKGTNPPNAKEKQGELYEESPAVKDSLVAEK